MPFVLFQVESQAARPAAAACMELWEQQGAALTDALLPNEATTDTIACLVLGSAAFAAHFSHRLPDWGVGVAMPPGRVIALDHQRLNSVGKSVREVFLHEMVHALLFQGAGEAYLPTWFHEGAAMLHSGEWRFRDTVSLALEGRVPKLDQLQGPFPSQAARADRAYRTSLLAVGRLQDRHGPDVIRRLVGAARRTGDFESAFFETTGQTLGQFAASFDRDMNLRYGWLVMLTRWPTLFVLMALILAFGAIAKIRRARRRLAEMDDFE